MKLIRPLGTVCRGTIREDLQRWCRGKDFAIVGGVIAQSDPTHERRLGPWGYIVCPGLVDLHVHLREPGQGHKETIETGTAAAAAGGFTFVACMPNTHPAIDCPETVRWVIQEARRFGYCEVGPVAAITRGRRGEDLTDFESLLGAGAVAFSDDGTGVEDDALMLAAFEQAAALDALLIQHCEYKDISAGGVMHKGAVSARLGVPGLDPRSEEAMIERDLELCRRTRGRYHVAHISTARAVELVRRAKAEGLPVTSEVTPHHLILTDEACAGVDRSEGGQRLVKGHLAPAEIRGVLDPNTKMHPPLRPWSDVEACRLGLLDGTIDCIATDHAPHSAEEKAAGFLRAPAGIIGLETAIGVSAMAMIESGLADWPQLIGWFTTGPAQVLKRPPARLEAGETADLTILDPNLLWTVGAEGGQSKSSNTPFDGWTLKGQAVTVIHGKTLIEIVPNSLWFCD